MSPTAMLCPGGRGETGHSKCRVRQAFRDSTEPQLSSSRCQEWRLIRMQVTCVLPWSWQPQPSQRSSLRVQGWCLQQRSCPCQSWAVADTAGLSLAVRAVAMAPQARLCLFAGTVCHRHQHSLHHATGQGRAVPSLHLLHGHRQVPSWEAARGGTGEERQRMAVEGQGGQQ